MIIFQFADQKKYNFRQGFSLIELMVAMFIFSMLLGGMIAVSIAGLRSYGKSKAVKTVTEDVGFAMNSIAKDVRMGKIESAGKLVSAALPSSDLIVTRNSSREIIRYEVTPKKMISCKCADADCLDAGRTNCKDMVDLTLTDMNFDLTTSGFHNQKTDTTSATKNRGWAQINLNIESPTMEKDSIRVQTVVSSRDYGWEEVP